MQREVKVIKMEKMNGKFYVLVFFQSLVLHEKGSTFVVVLFKFGLFM